MIFIKTKHFASILWAVTRMDIKYSRLVALTHITFTIFFSNFYYVYSIIRVPLFSFMFIFCFSKREIEVNTKLCNTGNKEYADVPSRSSVVFIDSCNDQLIVQLAVNLLLQIYITYYYITFTIIELSFKDCHRF